MYMKYDRQICSKGTRHRDDCCQAENSLHSWNPCIGMPKAVGSRGRNFVGEAGDDDWHQESFGDDECLADEDRMDNEKYLEGRMYSSFQMIPRTGADGGTKNQLIGG